MSQIFNNLSLNATSNNHFCSRTAFNVKILSKSERDVLQPPEALRRAAVRVHEALHRQLSAGQASLEGQVRGSVREGAGQDRAEGHGGTGEDEAGKIHEGKVAGEDIQRGFCFAAEHQLRVQEGDRDDEGEEATEGVGSLTRGQEKVVWKAGYEQKSRKLR